MEDDDEFGDLYSDVLPPSAPPPPPVQSTPLPSSRPIDTPLIPSDDEEIPYGSKSFTNLKLNLNKGVIGTDKVLEDDTAGKGEILLTKDENLDENFGIEDGGEEGFMIPGISTSGARVLEAGGDDGDEWDDSDSEDDLQIVLNDDTGVGMMGLNEEDDENGDDLVIVNNQPIEEIVNWGEDVNQAADGGGERSELGGHGYHSFHSQFKYVRPGAAPIPGAGPAVGGAPGQVRTPGGQLPFGRGRGEWRPAGVNKNVHSGYGLQGWGNNGAGRGFGTGVDFTLPSHKTIFEVDIDGFEEKPWRLQGIDVSDFFNFGMNEESWKEYRKQLDQHRLEATMQSKIRVYESGRTEQEYDPDLPPELAAAAGHEIPSENHNIVKIDVHSDLPMGPAYARMQLPTGRAIQVETSFSERLPSIDTRPPRMRDSDAIIEIVLQRSPSPDPEDVSSKDNKKDEIGSEGDRFNGGKREVIRERVPHFLESEVEDHKHSPSSSRLTLGSAEYGSFDQTEPVKENDDNTLKDEKSKHKMKKQKLITRAEPSSVKRGDDREDSVHSVSIRKPVNETRARQSNQGYRSYPMPENYDRKRSKESEHRSRKPSENGGWTGDHEGSQSKREEPYRESSSRRKRERERDSEREKDKSWAGHTRLKEDSRTSIKDYPYKETGREPVSRREKFENETGSRHRGREDVHGVQDKKHKETLKKGKEIDGAIHSYSSTSRRNREDNSRQTSERASSRSNTEQRANDQNPARKSSKKRKEKETASSDDDRQESKKGRSKLERWTSHKEKDFSLDIKETDTRYKHNAPLTKLPEESIKPHEPNIEDAKPLEDKHLDTVEKLKKRSERFKLPMPSEKEALTVKKIENEPLVSAQPESEVKPERRARKRQWTSG